MRFQKAQKQIIYVFFSLLVMLFLTGCERDLFRNTISAVINKNNESDIKSLVFTYSAYPNDNDFKLKIENENSVPVLRYESFRTYEYGEYSTEISAETVRKLNELYNENKVYLWNGFNAKMNPLICDGDFFTIEIRFEDGRTCEAKGYVKKPKNYREFISGVKELLQPDIDRALDKKKQEVIDQGLEGSPRYFAFTYDNGAEDYYHEEYYTFAFEKQSNGLVNIYTQVHSEPGKYFDECDNVTYRYDGLPEDAVDFRKIDDLIRKYKLLGWIRNGKECRAGESGFSVEALYDNWNLEVSGDLSDKQEAEFKDEFLRLMAEMLPDTVKKYDLRKYNFFEEVEKQQKEGSD